MPVAAGRFYPEKKDDLLTLIEQCFCDAKRGVGGLPDIVDSSNQYSGLVVPHAGISISGPIAAHSYAWLAKRGFADVCVLIGPNHTGFGADVGVFSKGTWSTPLGQVAVDSQFSQSLVRQGLVDDESAHQFEHSIEVQLPFLQYLGRKRPFLIVPISMLDQQMKTAQMLGERIAEVAKKYPSKRIAVVASTDFSHVGPNYSVYPPDQMQSHEYGRMQDEKALERILDFDAKGLIKVVLDQKISMCGSGPVAATLVAMKNLGAQSVELLKYGDSYEVWPDSSVVGYGSLAIW